MVRRLTFSLLALLSLALASASELTVLALSERLATSHQDYLDSRRNLLPSLTDTFGVASKARVVEEVPEDWHVATSPWRRNIRATIFWVGEKATPRNPTPNDASSWDPQWQQNFGGVDTPDKRDGYLPADFVPRQTPFYIALPYNDLVAGGGHQPEASEVIPWFWKLHTSPTKSVCHGRWLAIHREGRICYAMWRDSGPFYTDDWEYVFRNARPKKNPNGNAGIDVSPAVRDYLKMEGNDLLDWKFVEDFAVPDGPWKNWQPTNKS